MKPQDTSTLITSLAPVASLAPPVLIAAALGIGLLWIAASEENPEAKNTPLSKAKRDADPPAPSPGKLLSKGDVAAKRISRDDIAEALAYGARTLTRKEAVAALQTLGFRKTAAYKALSPQGKFGDLITLSSDGLIEWRG